MKRLILIIFTIGIVAFSAVPARADSPYTTWAIGPRGWLVMTQDAYTPFAEIAWIFLGRRTCLLPRMG